MKYRRTRAFKVDTEPCPRLIDFFNGGSYIVSCVVKASTAYACAEVASVWAWGYHMARASDTNSGSSW